MIRVNFKGALDSNYFNQYIDIIHMTRSLIDKKENFFIETVFSQKKIKSSYVMVFSK